MQIIWYWKPVQNIYLPGNCKVFSGGRLINANADMRVGQPGCCINSSLFEETVRDAEQETKKDMLLKPIDYNILSYIF
jgi:hypothetical protein